MLDNPPATVDVLTAAQRVAIARHPGRPGVVEIVNALFTDFFEQRGDLSSTDDPSIMGGIALFHGRPVTVLGNRKGSDIEERVACNFGMASPEGYRKAQRIMRAAEKFGRPVLTFVDTSGAYPGMEAEMGNCDYHTDRKVIVDGKLITSRGPGTATAFGLELARILCGAETADATAQGMLLK